MARLDQLGWPVVGYPQGPRCSVGHNTPPMTVDADDAAGLRAELANWGR
jgi:hypothetical protein